MNQSTCKTCQYFLQHYAYNGKHFHLVYCGHCTFQKPKGRRPDASACENYVRCCEDREKFATREYLTKELLRYVLSLEIFPEAK